MESKTTERHYRQDYPKRVGFDFDGVLSNSKLYQIYASHLVSSGVFVCIITKRSVDDGQPVLDMAKELGIKSENVFFTDNQNKSPVVDRMRLTKFYDDDKINIQDIRENTDCKTFLVK